MEGRVVHMMSLLIVLGLTGCKKEAGSGGGGDLKGQLQNRADEIMAACKAGNLSSAASMMSRKGKALDAEKQAGRVEKTCKQLEGMADGYEVTGLSDEDRGKFKVLAVSYKNGSKQVELKLAFEKLDETWRLADID